MKINVYERGAYENYSDIKLIGFFKDEDTSLRDLEEEIKKVIRVVIEEDEFKADYGKLQGLRLNRKNFPNKLLLMGYGKREDLDSEKIRKLIVRTIKEAERLKAKSIEIRLIKDDFRYLSLEDVARIITETLILSQTRIDKYISKTEKPSIKEVNLICNDEDLETVTKGRDEGRILGNATAYARELVNEPANILVPVELANRARISGEESGFEVEIYGEEKIQELGMEAYWAVSKASNNPPRFIVMRYFGNESDKSNVIGLVGKGLTYDSGGLSIKSKEGMLNMKCDMGGSAAVIGAMRAIAEAKLPVNIITVVAACENMISGKGYRPGDIIQSMAQKSIFIGSTDAEGRLTLVDAIHYIIEKEGVNKVVDIATLTGAAIAALGVVATPIITNNDEFYRKLEKASEISGEKIWRMPIFDEYKEQIKSKVADLTNSAGQPGTITAALFIGEFVQDKPWIHMDIAGTAWSSKSTDLTPEGGTGGGVRTLYHLVKNINN